MTVVIRVHCVQLAGPLGADLVPLSRADRLSLCTKSETLSVAEWLGLGRWFDLYSGQIMRVRTETET